MATQNNQEEIDVLQFFNAFGNFFKNFFNSIFRFFKSLFFLGIDFLLYIKKNLIYLTLGLIIGVAISFLIPNKVEKYYGKALIRTNYGAQSALKEKVDLLNGLIENKDTVELSNILDLPVKQVSKLKYIKLSPVINDVYLLDDYEEFLRTKDTTVYKFLEYDQYKNNIEKNDQINQYWDVEVIATGPDAFNNLNPKFTALFNNDEHLIKRKETYLSALKLHIDKNLKSLIDIDTMRQIFNKAILRLADKQTNGTNVVVGIDKISGPEQPYNLFQERRNTLNDNVILARKLNKYDDVVIVLNAFPQIGIKEVSIISNIHIKYGLIGFMFVLLLLWLKDFNAYLTRYESSKKKTI
jgi:hypothetical protein